MDVVKMAAGEARTQSFRFRGRKQAWEPVARKRKFLGLLSLTESNSTGLWLQSLQPVEMAGNK